MDKKTTFAAAVKDNENLLTRIASVYTNNREDRHDLMQEIIFQLWKSYDGFRYGASFRTWMFRVALNVSLYQVKKSKRRIEITPLDQYEYLTDNADEAVDEKWRLLKEALDQLNPLDKALVMLYLDSKSHQEIAEIIGISVSNVGTKIARIKNKLKSHIKNNN